jgi:hypothetical protein
VSKDSITLVSATEISAGGGSLDLIFITLSSRGFLNSWPEETSSCPVDSRRAVVQFWWEYSRVDWGCRNNARTQGFALREEDFRAFSRTLVCPTGAEASKRGDSMGEVCTGAGSIGLPCLSTWVW